MWPQGASAPSRYPAGLPAADAQGSRGSVMLKPLPQELKQQDPLFGSEICKNFGSQWFHGRVVDIEVDDRSRELAYLVQYDDGDREHMSTSAVRAHLWRLRNAPERHSNAAAEALQRRASTSGLRRPGGCTVDPPTPEGFCVSFGFIFVIALLGAATWLLWGLFFPSSSGHEAYTVDFGSIESTFTASSGPSWNSLPQATPSAYQPASPAAPTELAKASGPAPTERRDDVKSFSRFPEPAPKQVVPRMHHFTADVSPSGSPPGAISAQGLPGADRGNVVSDEEAVEWMPGDADLDFMLVVVLLIALGVSAGCFISHAPGSAVFSSNMRTHATISPQSPMLARTQVPFSPLPQRSPTSSEIMAALAPSPTPTRRRPRSPDPIIVSESPFPVARLASVFEQKATSREPAHQASGFFAWVATPSRSSAAPQTPIHPRKRR